MEEARATPDYGQSVYECALECALRRKKYHDCRNEFDSEQCWECKIFIRRFMQGQNEAALELYMLQAEKEACGQILARRGRSWAYGALIAGLLAMALFSYKSDKAYDERTARIEADRAQQQRLANVPARAGQPTKVEISIEKTLEATAKDLFARVDVNRDREINCIDAAVIFYKHYPDKSLVCIEENVNKTTGMNHLFNVVLIDGNWRALEPQSYWKGFNSYWMKDVWGDRYDKAFNKDVTKDYLKYVK